MSINMLNIYTIPNNSYQLPATFHQGGISFLIYKQGILTMIPKKIFYMWCGSQTPIEVEKCILSWRLNLPDYEIIDLGNPKNKYFNLKKACLENEFLCFAYKNKMWAYVADYARFYVLSKFGGIWLDTDITVLKSFDNLLKFDFFCGRNSPDGIYIETAVIGAVSHHEIIENSLDFYNDKIWKSALYTSPHIITQSIKNYGINISQKGEILHNNCIIFGPEYFYPYKFGEQYNASQITENTLSIHWWQASWTRREVVEWLKNKHILGRKKSLAKTLSRKLNFYLFSFLKIGVFHIDEGRFCIFTIPILSVKQYKNKKKCVLFGFIPLLKWK